MNISDLKKYLNTLPKECDEYEIIIRDIIDNNTSLTAFDAPIKMMMTDDNNECVCFLDEQSSKIVTEKLLPKIDN